ncbi:RpoL/Rpb11 RNA polymerase subunit family protein [Thermoproteota archaeon]
MEIKVLEEKKNRMVFEIVGESHGFCNALKKALWKSKGVIVSGYNVEHPLTASPKVIVETEGSKSPRDAVVDAAKLMNKESDNFLKSFSKQVK